MKRAWRLFVDFGWVGISVFFTLSALAKRHWLLLAVWLVIGALHSHLAYTTHQQRKEREHGHWQPRGSHRGRRARGGRAHSEGGAGGDDGAQGGAGPRLASLPPGVVISIQGTASPQAIAAFKKAMGAVSPGSEWYKTQGAAFATRETPERKSTDTIRAWKRGAIDLIAMHPGPPRPVLVGPVSGRYLAVDYGTAECLPFFKGISPHKEGLAPRVDCTCGFYAVKDRHALDGPLDSGVAVLEVELFGRVVCHERGYRAQRQRILSVTLDRMCHICLDTEAECIGVGGGLWRVPYGGFLAPSPTDRQWSGALCSACVGNHDPGATFTADDLAHALRTEVRWAAAA